MKRTILLLLLSTLILFGLSACERPAPGSQEFPATLTPSVINPGVVTPLSPPLGISPTPALIPSVDPNMPGGIVPTATLDPALAPPATEPTPAPPVEQPTAEPPPDTSTGETIHTVVAGDNLYRIGLQYGFTYQELAEYNGLVNPDRLDIGQQIRIPPRP